MFKPKLIEKKRKKKSKENHRKGKLGKKVRNATKISDAL